MVDQLVHALPMIFGIFIGCGLMYLLMRDPEVFASGLLMVFGLLLGVFFL